MDCFKSQPWCLSMLLLSPSVPWPCTQGQASVVSPFSVPCAGTSFFFFFYFYTGYLRNTLRVVFKIFFSFTVEHIQGCRGRGFSLISLRDWFSTLPLPSLPAGYWPAWGDWPKPVVGGRQVRCRLLPHSEPGCRATPSSLSIFHGMSLSPFRLPVFEAGTKNKISPLNRRKASQYRRCQLTGTCFQLGFFFSFILG